MTLQGLAACLDLLAVWLRRCLTAQLLAEGCTPNLVTSNILIDIYGKTGQWARAVEVLDNLQAQVGGRVGGWVDGQGAGKPAGSGWVGAGHGQCKSLTWQYMHSVAAFFAGALGHCRPMRVGAVLVPLHCPAAADLVWPCKLSNNAISNSRQLLGRSGAMR